MLKRKLYKKIMITTIALFTLLLIYVIPSSRMNNSITVKQTLEYIDSAKTSEIYLVDHNDYVARTIVPVANQTDIEKRVKELISILTIGSGGESKVPSGFKAIIPEDARLISLLYENGVIKLNFSKELLDVKKKDEEKLIEAIVYSVTTIPEIKNVIIYIEEEPLILLPKTKINLPATLNRSLGINKSYEFTSLEDINDVTIYYVNKYNDDYYYVPVTKYMNNQNDKIKIIIEELSAGPIADTNLMSFLNSNTKLLAVEELEDTINLEFNDYIFNDLEKQNILEEVIYSICLSVEDNYDVKEVNFIVNNEEIYKSVLKTIE